jgi:hypothetical protein
MEACYGGTDVMERSCAVARGIDINNIIVHLCSTSIRTQHRFIQQYGAVPFPRAVAVICLCRFDCAVPVLE